MSSKIPLRLSLITVGLLLVGQLAWSAASWAQDVSGQASAVRATVSAMTTTLADTGTLSGTGDVRGIEQTAGGVPFLLTGETLHAATAGWDDQTSSEASLGNLTMTVAGTGISADLVMARAFQALGAAAEGRTNIDGLKIAGAPVFPTGAPNETFSLGVLTVVLNEQIPSANGITVNALHVKTFDGLTDVVIGSAKAGISSTSSSSGPLPLPLPSPLPSL